MSNESWKQSGVKVRDARHTKVEDTATPSLPSKKKDTKKWCRGKVGTQHELKCFVYKNDNGSKFTKCWYVLSCMSCGKEMDHYYGTFVNSKKPDWVVDEVFSNEKCQP